MIKVKVKVGTTYAGCPAETAEFEYDGTEKDFENDHEVSTQILNMLFDSGFPHYFIDYETEEIMEDAEEDEDE